MNTLGTSSAIFQWEATFVTSYLLSYELNHDRTESAEKEKNLLPRRGKFFPLKVDPCCGGKQNQCARVASLAREFILKYDHVIFDLDQYHLP